MCQIKVVEGIVRGGVQALVDGVAELVAVERHGGDPTPFAITELALRREFEAEIVPAHQVHALAFFRDLVQFGDEQRRGAVETVEIGGLVAEIGEVGRHADARNQVLAVEEGVVDGVALGIPGGFHVDLPFVVGIDGSVAVLIDVGQGAVVPAEVGGIADGGQRAEVDAGFLDFFLRRCGADRRKQQNEGHQSFHRK